MIASYAHPLAYLCLMAYVDYLTYLPFLEPWHPFKCPYLSQKEPPGGLLGRGGQRSLSKDPQPSAGARGRVAVGLPNLLV